MSESPRSSESPLTVETADRLIDFLQEQPSLLRQLGELGLTEIETQEQTTGTEPDTCRMVHVVAQTVSDQTIRLFSLMEGDETTVQAAAAELFETISVNRQRIFEMSKGHSAIFEVLPLRQMITTFGQPSDRNPLQIQPEDVAGFAPDDMERLFYRLWQQDIDVVNQPVQIHRFRAPNYFQMQRDETSEKARQAPNDIEAIAHLIKANEIIAYQKADDPADDAWGLTVVSRERMPDAEKGEKTKGPQRRLEKLRLESLRDLLYRKLDAGLLRKLSFAQEHELGLKDFYVELRVPCFDGALIVADDDPQMIRVVSEVRQALEEFSRVRVELSNHQGQSFVLQLCTPRKEWRDTTVDPEYEQKFKGADSTGLNDNLKGSMDKVDEGVIKKSLSSSEKEADQDNSENLMMVLDERLNDLDFSDRMGIEVGTSPPDSDLYNKASVLAFNFPLPFFNGFNLGPQLIDDAQFDEFLAALKTVQRRDQNLYFYCQYKRGNPCVLSVIVYKRRR